MLAILRSGAARFLLDYAGRTSKVQWASMLTIMACNSLHEAYLKLAGSNADFANRRHFYATASRAMRQILMNYAERRRTAKRDGDVVSLEVENLPFASDEAIEDLLTLHELLGKLDEKNPRRCRIIECCVFGGVWTCSSRSAALSVRVHPKARQAPAQGADSVGSRRSARGRL
jgi:hypothetical protein